MDKNYKRTHRELDDATKMKISAKLKGKSKSYTHTQNISQGLKTYWEGVPHREESESSDDEE